MSEETKRILIVEDDVDHLALIERYTSSIGYAYELAANGIIAEKKLQETSYDLVLTDIVMPEGDGMYVVKAVKELHPETPVLVMTGFNKLYSYMDVINAGAVDFIHKPFKKDEYEAKIRRIFREKKLIEELTRAKDAAEEINKQRNDFLNTISHELRTPMNGIVGFTDIMLTSGDVTEEQNEHLQLIKESSDRLLELINKLLDFSNVDVFKQEISLEQFSLKNIFSKVVFAHKSKAQAKDIQIRSCVDEQVSGEIIGGASLLLKVLNHLVDNALKFSDEGEVVIKAGLESNDNESGSLKVHFSVADNGCGISDEEKRNIFKPFTQVENYLTRKHGGAGIGLAICARLVRFLHGEIWVESTKGNGAVFHFTGEFSAL